MRNLFNTCTFQGNLAKDVQVLESGVAIITVAIDPIPYIDNQGNKVQPPATFVDVLFRSKRFDNALQYFIKGKTICLEATVQPRSIEIDCYENRKKVTKTYSGYGFWMNEFRFVTSTKK